MCEGGGGIANADSTEMAVILDEAGVEISPGSYGGVGGKEYIWLLDFRLEFLLASESLW